MERCFGNRLPCACEHTNLLATHKGVRCSFRTVIVSETAQQVPGFVGGGQARSYHDRDRDRYPGSRTIRRYRCDRSTSGARTGWLNFGRAASHRHQGRKTISGSLAWGSNVLRKRAAIPGPAPASASAVAENTRQAGRAVSRCL
jgi:hypothetical protein